MKKLKLIVAVTSLSLLIGCAKKDDKQEQSSDNAQKNAQVTKITDNNKNKSAKSKSDTEMTSESVIGEEANLEFGKKVIKKAAINLNETHESGPFRVRLNNITINELTPTKDFVEYFGTSDTFTMILVNLTVENTSDETNSIYPEQSSLVTNTKEQLVCDGSLSEAIGGEYIGKVIKEGSILFYTTTKPEEINSVKLVIDAPHDENLDPIGDKIVIEHQL